MTNDEAIAIIRNEYKCVDRDCDIERNCGKCDLMMPSKEPILEAYKLAIKALEQQPCDAISREAALEKMADYVASGYADSAEDFEEYSRIICQLPPVTPQKHGKWKVVSDGYGDNAYICECSECKDTVWVYKDADRKWNYCPSCGAKMFEPQESEDKTE